MGSNGVLISGQRGLNHESLSDMTGTTSPLLLLLLTGETDGLDPMKMAFAFRNQPPGHRRERETFLHCRRSA